jgi:PAS domain S-box-containing protein
MTKAELRSGLKEERLGCMMAALDAAIDGVAVIDLDLRFECVNPALASMLGYQGPEDIIGREVADFLTEDTIPRLREHAQGAFPGRSAMLEGTSRGADGRLVPIEVGASVLRDEDGEPCAFLAIVRDISERKRVEEALRESREKMSAIIENVGVGIVLISPQMEILELNRAMREWFPEVDPTGKPACYRAFNDPPGEAPCSYCPTIKTLQDGQVHEEITETPAGYTIRNYRIVSTPIRDTLGNVVAAIEMVEDVTERKRAEQTLRESESRYRMLFENMNDAAFLADPEAGIILEANKQAEVLLGRTRDEIIGMHQSELHPPGQADKYREKFERHIRAGRIPDYDAEVLRKDGASVPVTICASAQQIAGRQLLLALFRDITERKQVEEALRESQERYRVISEGSGLGILIADSETRQFVYANPCVCRLLGYTERELLQLGVADIHPKDSLGHVASEFESLVRGEKTLASELPCLRKDGTVFYADVTAGRIILNGGQECLVGFFADVTERKQVEKALRESTDQLQAIYNCIADGLVVAEVETGRIVRVSPAACAMFGYSEREFLEKRVSDLHPAASLGTVEAAFHAQAEGEQVMAPGLPCARKDGSIFLADVAARPTIYAGRRCLVGFFRDITERKRAEEALQESERKFRTLVENLPQKIFYKDRDSIYVSCNDNYARDLKVSADGITGKTDYDFYPQELAEKYRADDKRVMDSGTTEDIEEVYIEAGERRWVHTIKTPVRDESGNIVGVLGIFWDITERKREQEEILFKNALLEAQTEASIDGILVVDSARKMISFNRRFVEMWGIPQEAVDSRSGERALQSEIEKLTDPEAFLARVRYLYDHRDEQSRDEIPLRDGRTFDRYAAPVRGADGTYYGRVWYFRDITERKQGEKALEAKNRELESFVYSASHDLRAPLVSIEGFSKLLADEYSERLDTEGQDYLGRLRANVSTMNSLLTDLLELSRIGRAEEPRAAVAVGEVVTEALDSLAQMIHKCGARVRAADDLPTVGYSRTRLLQVFTNLISNAIKFSRQGEVPQVEVGWEMLAEGVRFFVKDNGIGIAQEHRQKAFEIFSRLKQKDVEGSGIGLAIVKRIVENHGGEVGVDSIPGQGSTFSFTVPRHAASD